MHFGVAFALLVLGGGGRGDDCRIHYGPFPHEQVVAGQVGVHFIEDLLGKRVTLQDTTEL